MCGAGEREASRSVCMPTLTNWIEPPVDRKGSVSVRLTYEEDWHSGWSGQSVGGVRVAESMMCVSSQPWHHAEGKEALDMNSLSGLYLVPAAKGCTVQRKSCH